MQAHLVLHLHHHHGLVASVDGLQVPHECRKGLGISLAGLLSQRGEDGQGLALGCLSQREALGVGLHPFRGIAGDAVLPAAEPQQGEPQVVCARAGEQVIYHGKVVFPLSRLYLLPRHYGQHGVHAAFLELFPVGLHVFPARGRGVAQFAAQCEERLAVDDELCDVAPFLQMGWGGLLVSLVVGLVACAVA